MRYYSSYNIQDMLQTNAGPVDPVFVKNLSQFLIEIQQNYTDEIDNLRNQMYNIEVENAKLREHIQKTTITYG